MTAAPTRVPPLALTDQGTGGPTLLFVPGWCGDRSVFDGLARRTATHHRSVTVDLPDHGGSPAREELTTADVVDDLVATVDALGLGAVVPVTLSHAGWTAVELRRRLGPQAVPGVVLLDWMVLGTPPGFAETAGFVRTTLSGLGVDLGGVTTVDSSGLSRENQLTFTTFSYSSAVLIAIGM